MGSGGERSSPLLLLGAVVRIATKATASYCVQDEDHEVLEDPALVGRRLRTRFISSSKCATAAHAHRQYSLSQELSFKNS